MASIRHIISLLAKGLTIFSPIQNVAAVTSTSTRTPIYKAYAKGENIGDVTAKGESVGNIADLVTIYILHLVLLFFIVGFCIIMNITDLICKCAYITYLTFIYYLFYEVGHWYEHSNVQEESIIGGFICSLVLWISA